MRNSKETQFPYEENNCGKGVKPNYIPASKSKTFDVTFVSGQDVYSDAKFIMSHVQPHLFIIFEKNGVLPLLPVVFVTILCLKFIKR